MKKALRRYYSRVDFIDIIKYNLKAMFILMLIPFFMFVADCTALTGSWLGSAVITVKSLGITAFFTFLFIPANMLYDIRCRKNGMRSKKLCSTQTAVKKTLILALTDLLPSAVIICISVYGLLL